MPLCLGCAAPPPPRRHADALQQTRTFAAVIFRRQSSKPRKTPSGQTADLFLTLQPAEREAIRAKLLQCLANEADASVRGKVGDAVAELARQHTDEGTSGLPARHKPTLTRAIRCRMAGAPRRPVPGQPVARPCPARERLQDLLDHAPDHREAA